MRVTRQFSHWSQHVSDVDRRSTMQRRMHQGADERLLINHSLRYLLNTFNIWQLLYKSITFGQQVYVVWERLSLLLSMYNEQSIVDTSIEELAIHWCRQMCHTSTTTKCMVMKCPGGYLSAWITHSWITVRWLNVQVIECRVIIRRWVDQFLAHGLGQFPTWAVAQGRACQTL